MLKNYFKTALRNLLRQKGFSAINLIGLALGMACSLLILLWVQDERSVDAFHRNGDRLYYVYERNYMGGKLQTWYWTQGPLAEELKAEIPEVQAATPISWSNTNTFAVGEKVLKEDGFAAGSEYFTMFSYPLIEGSAKDALSTPDGLAISRKMAVAFFGSPATAMGKAIRYENKKSFMVKAVFEDFSPLLSNQGNFIMPWKGYIEDGNQWAEQWASVDPRTVILLRPGADAGAVEKKIRHITEKFETEQKNIRIELGLQRFSDYYLRSEFRDGVPTGGRIEYVRLFSIVALFILLIACINFMNLTTARSVKRAKEIGVRKVMGAVRGLLIRQFIGEAILMAVLSAILALVIISLALPAFNQLTGKEIVLPINQLSFWASFVGITLLTGLVSGSYPAFYLSGFNPIRVLKAALPSGTKGDALFRRGLVVFQFVLSIVLILSTVLISRQVNFMRNAQLGYDRENLVYLPIEGDLGKKLEVFRTEAMGLPGVQAVSMSSGSNPTMMGDGTLSIGWTGKDPNVHERFIQEVVSPDFLTTMKVRLVAGRTLDPGTYPTDSSGVLLNETAVKLMGYKDPVGKPVYSGNYPLHIVGVIKDFHFQSLHDPILPLILGAGRKEWYGNILVRLKAGQTPVALAGLERLCKELNPAFPFTYKFSDAEYAKLYKSEEITGRLSIIFAILGIVISCLGLLGLSMFTAEQRLREIGIRKILGASVGGLFGLLSRNFLGLVALAFLIGAPLGWWAMHQWLSGFAYQTDIPWWTFAIAGIVALLVALVTVCWQTIRAARTNPIKSLRPE